MPTAVGAVGAGVGVRESQLAVSESTPLRATVLSGLQLSIPSREAKEVLSGVLKTIHHVAFKRNSYGSVLVCLCPSLTRQRSFNLFRV